MILMKIDLTDGVYAVLLSLFIPFVWNFQSSPRVICCSYVLHNSEREPDNQIAIMKREG